MSTETIAPVETPWLRVKEAAAYSNRSDSLILRALRSGELRGHQRGKRGGTWTIHRADLDAWIRGETADVQPAAVSTGSRRTA